MCLTPLFANKHK